jgi:hypothetical protein
MRTNGRLNTIWYFALIKKKKKIKVACIQRMPVAEVLGLPGTRKERNGELHMGILAIL